MTTENIVKVGSTGFDQESYKFVKYKESPALVPVEFQLMDDRDRATIHYWKHLDGNGQEVGPIIVGAIDLTQSDTQKKTIYLEEGSFTIKLPFAENNYTSASGTNSGTIDVSGTPIPGR